jgi:hypothetical protein
MGWAELNAKVNEIIYGSERVTEQDAIAGN